MQDFRVDPFQNKLQAVNKTELRLIPSNSPYSITTLEVPLPPGDSPSSLKITPFSFLKENTTETQTLISITDTTSMPFLNNEVLKIDNEKMLITNIAPDNKSLTVIRGYDNTVPTTHNLGTNVYGVEFSEVAAFPAKGEFWADYSTNALNNKSWNTGKILFNASDRNTMVKISYSAMGTLASVKAPSYPAWTTDYGRGEKGHIVCANNEEYIGIIECESFIVPEGVTINVGSGIIPTVLKSCGAVIINGNVNGVGRGAYATNGVGSGAGGGIRSDALGFGGLLHGAPYTKGGTDTTRGESMPASGVLEMVRLGLVGIGASGGVGSGTAGGGAGLMIVAPEIYITGNINLSGKKGDNVGSKPFITPYPGGGGGAFLTASKLYQLTSEILVNGGSGASYDKSKASAGGAGWIYNYVLGVD